MPRDLDWQATDDPARAQLDLFVVPTEEAGLTQDEKGRALDLDYQVWAKWTGFPADGPLPENPPLPDMALRLAGSLPAVLRPGAEARGLARDRLWLTQSAGVHHAIKQNARR